MAALDQPHLEGLAPAAQAMLATLERLPSVRPFYLAVKQFFVAEARRLGQAWFSSSDSGQR